MRPLAGYVTSGRQYGIKYTFNMLYEYPIIAGKSKFVNQASYAVLCLSKDNSLAVHPRNDRQDSTKASQCPTLVASIIYRHTSLKFVENIRLKNQRRSVFIASKIKVLKVQTAEAAIRVQIYQTPSSKVQGPLAKCTWLTNPRTACRTYLYTWLLGAFHLQSDWTYCQTSRTFRH